MSACRMQGNYAYSKLPASQRLRAVYVVGCFDVFAEPRMFAVDYGIGFGQGMIAQINDLLLLKKQMYANECR